MMVVNHRLTLICRRILEEELCVRDVDDQLSETQLDDWMFGLVRLVGPPLGGG